MLSAGGGIGPTHHLPTIIDRLGQTARAAERAQVAHLSALPEEGMLTTRDAVAPAHDLPVGVNPEGLANLVSAAPGNVPKSVILPFCQRKCMLLP